jgi:PKD repeat protein
MAKLQKRAIQPSLYTTNLTDAQLFMNSYFYRMKKIPLILIASVMVSLPLFCQSTMRVLFLGNSYTAVNDLPGMLADVAVSAGDTVIFDSNTPGGFTLQGHSTDAGSLGKIAAGNWDYVVLQEQSQLPSFPPSQVQTQVFPYAKALDSLIHLSNPCAETVFYMTWGRKNGDASNCSSWPPVCTYQGMDSLLRLRYMTMADDNDALVSPAGAVWRYIRSKYPTIELYETDESHPSYAGTYAIACTFYTILFEKDPQLIAFTGTLDPTVADQIKSSAKAVAFDSLATWFVGAYHPDADFNFTVSSDTVRFTNQSGFASQYSWDFGDGSSDTAANPQHIYLQNGNYQVLLKAAHCGLEDTISKTVQVVSIGLEPTVAIHELKLFPNPVNDLITLLLPFELVGENSAVLICSPNGQMIRKENIPSGVHSFNISVSGLPAGVWVVSVVSGHDHASTFRGFFIKRP